MMTKTQATQSDLNQETSKIAWRELQRFFAKGSAVFVAAELDLLAVSEAFAQDNKATVEQWMQAKQVALVTDEQALAWFEADSLVWAIVVKPWILVQDAG